MVDPIFAAIAEHQRRRAEHEAAFDAAGEAELSGFPDDPLAAEAGARRDAASEREVEALEQVLRAVPLTTAGMLAWLDQISGPAGFDGIAPRDADVAAIFGTVRAFVAANGGAHV